MTELIVVVTIATIIMTVLVIQQGKWNDRLAVNVQTYELALMIRQAQVYSLGVRECTLATCSGDKFNIGYGIYLDEDNDDRYIFFADRNGNKKYDDGEMIEEKLLTRGVSLQRFCGTGPHPCSDGPSDLDQVNISFLRPEPKAEIEFLNNGGQTSVGISSPVNIRFISPGGKVSAVKVESNGQVSITQ